ncbi:hypothetical protein [Psychromonas arctica]|uniref:hypothetical protein n=1 Tax=Psychromonas arctica TaxID=168275 RepID=UPI00040643A0|nr:hypothetical protein [Psychromonas arctica]
MTNQGFIITSLILILFVSTPAQSELVIIGNSKTVFSELNTRIISRIYTGKIIEIEGVSVIPINSIQTTALRNKFLEKYLSQDENEYSAYWTVRRFIGKGTPPKELASVTDIINYVGETPGAIGYIDTDSISVPSSVKIINQ